MKPYREHCGHYVQDTIIFWCSNACHGIHKKNNPGNSNSPSSLRDSSNSSRLPNAKCHCKGATAAPFYGTCQTKNRTFLEILVTFSPRKCASWTPLLLSHVYETEGHPNGPWPTAPRNGTPGNEHPSGNKSCDDNHFASSKNGFNIDIA